MMRFCLMDPRPFSWDRLIWMNRQWKGIVFVDFREENAPRFILDLIEELQREKIAESIAPCQTFAKSFMMISPAKKRNDLVLLLRPLNEEALSRLEQWRNNQGEQVVMILSDYVKQYAAEFTGIGQPVEAAKDTGGKAEQKQKDSPRKSKKDRRKDKRPSEEANSDTGSKATPDENATDDSAEVSNDGSEASNDAKEEDQ